MMIWWTAHNYYCHSSNRTVACVVFVCHRSTFKRVHENLRSDEGACMWVGCWHCWQKAFLCGNSNPILCTKLPTATTDWRQKPSSRTFSISLYILWLGDFHILHKLTGWAWSMCAGEFIYNTTSHLRRDEMRNHKILIFYMPFGLVLGLFHTHNAFVLSRSAGGAVAQALKSTRHVCHWPDFTLCIWYTFTDSHEAVRLPFNYSAYVLLILQYIISSHLSIMSNGNNLHHTYFRK